MRPQTPLYFNTCPEEHKGYPTFRYAKFNNSRTQSFNETSHTQFFDSRPMTPILYNREMYRIKKGIRLQYRPDMTRKRPATSFMREASHTQINDESLVPNASMDVLKENNDPSINPNKSMMDTFHAGERSQMETTGGFGETQKTVHDTSQTLLHNDRSIFDSTFTIGPFGSYAATRPESQGQVSINGEVTTFPTQIVHTTTEPAQVHLNTVQNQGEQNAGDPNNNNNVESMRASQLESMVDSENMLKENCKMIFQVSKPPTPRWKKKKGYDDIFREQHILDVISHIKDEMNHRSNKVATDIINMFSVKSHGKRLVSNLGIASRDYVKPFPKFVSLYEKKIEETIRIITSALRRDLRDKGILQMVEGEPAKKPPEKRDLLYSLKFNLFNFLEARRLRSITDFVKQNDETTWKMIVKNLTNDLLEYIDCGGDEHVKKIFQKMMERPKQIHQFEVIQDRVDDHKSTKSKSKENIFLTNPNSAEQSDARSEGSHASENTSLSRKFDPSRSSFLYSNTLNFLNTLQSKFKPRKKFINTISATPVNEEAIVEENENLN